MGHLSDDLVVTSTTVLDHSSPTEHIFAQAMITRNMTVSSPIVVVQLQLDFGLAQSQVIVRWNLDGTKRARLFFS